MLKNSPVVLCILDGWGVREQANFNAVKGAEFFNFLLKNFPNTTLSASGLDVGLPDGQMGNSEVGHMTISCGRVIPQDLTRIDQNLETALKQACMEQLISSLKLSNKCCHIIGLSSDGGVHSHINHILATAKYLSEHGIKVKLHLITDGRDTLPRSALSFVSQITDLVKADPLLSIATIGGRYYAMDRDNRLDRTQKAFDVIAGRGEKIFTCPIESIKKSYQQNISDEFLEMQSHADYSGIEPGDAIFFANFRADRMRQLFNALSAMPFARVITMTPYHVDALPKGEGYLKLADVLFRPQQPKNILSDVLYQNGLSQLRVAETEKYAHVTFFFDAARETAYPNERRIFINSPKVARYDLKPEMSAYEITNAVIENAAKADFILLNYANADMVGHTGNYAATLQAVKAVDDCLKKLYSCLVQGMNFTLVIVSDHGNAEYMFDEKNNSQHTAHTINPVPFIITRPKECFRLRMGGLSDVAPTILALMNINKPEEMTGTSLLEQLI